MADNDDQNLPPGTLPPDPLRQYESHVYGRKKTAPKRQRDPVLPALVPPPDDSRGISNRGTAPVNRMPFEKEINVPAAVTPTKNGSAFDFTGAPIGLTGVSDPVFQKGFDDVAKQFKTLRAQGKQPVIDVDGLASTSVRQAKGTQYYARERVKAIKAELVKRGIDPSAIKADVSRELRTYDPRSISAKKQGLNRGATVNIIRVEGEPDDGEIGKDYSFFDHLAGGTAEAIVGTLIRGSVGLPTPFDMHDSAGRIGRLASTLQLLFLVPFDHQHNEKLINAGIKLTEENVFNGSIRGAFRHTLWSALAARYLGPELTRAVNDVHDPYFIPDNLKPNQLFEGKDPDKLLARVDTAVDVYNNEIGIRIGRSLPRASVEEISYAVLLEAYAKGLWIAETFEKKGNKQNPNFRIATNQHQISLSELLQVHNRMKQIFDPGNKEDQSRFIREQIDSLEYSEKHPRATTPPPGVGF